jgi:lipid-A-disaccharide synthase-like uncharacterized protein
MHLKDLTIPQGDTENLLAQKLPLLSSRLIEQLKYWKLVAMSGGSLYSIRRKLRWPRNLRRANEKIYT